MQPNLQPVPEKEEARRLVEIEMAATNGMLYTLDPHSVLLDVETYKDMRTQTQGKFGGLGIVIEMDKKNRITVKRPMPDTPAIRVGMKPKDHIVRINNESTVNMTLTEAVDRLRGDVDTNVDVYVERDGVAGVKKFTITRASIRPPSIDPPARILATAAAPGQPPAKVGYFHMQHFSANSAGDLADALALFDREHVKGIIMDLRGDPGGLYEQAQKVSDAFIKSGTLVSMVGVGGAQRKDETATDSGHEPTVPLAVLVNQNSASASEIVAGAMKNLDRGVVIGEETFGKGSVQVLFDIPSPISFGDGTDDDKLGLKLTTAQYLTPGDISIQGVGVVPDIETDALLVQKEGDRSWIRLQPSSHKRRESDYEWHLEHPSARHGQKPEETVTYLFQPKANDKAKPHDDDEMDEDADDQADNDDEQSQKTDFLMDFARDLLAQAKSSKRPELVQQAKAFLDKVRAAEDKKVSQALEKLGVDWTAGPTTGADPELQLTLQTVQPGQAGQAGTDGKIPAGTTARLKGVVKNVGHTPAYRVRAVFDSDNPLFDENEMVFGKIAPGDSKSYELSVKVPASTFTRTDEIKATLYTQRGVTKAAAGDMLVNIEGKQRPMFAYSYQTIDDQKGANRDGLVQRGEQVRTLVTVKNIGLGRALHTEAVLRNGTSQEGILDQRRTVRGQGSRPWRIEDLLVRLRGEARVQRGRLPARALRRRHDAGRVGHRQDQGQDRAHRPGARDAVRHGDPRARRGAAAGDAGGRGSGGRPRRQGDDVQGDRQDGRLHARRRRRDPLRLRGQRRSQVGWHRSRHVQARLGGDAAAADGDRADGGRRGHRPHQGARHRRAAGARRLRPGLEPQREDPGEEGLLSAEPAGRRPDEDGLRRRGPLGAGSNLIQVFARESNEVQSLQTVVVLKRTGPNLVAQPSEAQPFPAAAAKPPFPAAKK